MKLKVFSVFDSKVQAYLQPFFMRSAGEALRAFESLANEANHQFCKHAGDFTLFEIGEYEDQSARLVSHEHYTNLGTALEYRKIPADGELFEPNGRDAPL